jgi:hypothetical protein
MNHSFYFENQKPIVYLTKNKTRLSRFGNCVYLQENTKFQIEIVNPTDKTVYAFIEIDGKNIGADILIEPKKAVSISRWQKGKNKRLKFKSKKSKENESTIHKLKNANIKVSFHEKLEESTSRNITANLIYPNNIWKYTEDFNVIFGGTTVNALYVNADSPINHIPFSTDTFYILPVIDDLNLSR